MRSRMGLLLAMAILGLCPAAAAAPKLKPGEEATFAIPRMASPPKIDGTIDPAEWRGASAVAGLVDNGSDCLLPRPTTWFLAWDPGHLYFACRTYLKPGYRFTVREGRSDGNAYCFDDGLELLFKPMGHNVSPEHQRTEFRLFMNCLGFVGDLTRIALGQQMKNWAPEFKVAARTTAPGTAPDGGSWWELEASSTPADFELTGNHEAGDRWKFMLGFNHVPMWMQARIPCVGSYFTADGKCVGTLVENMPAVQLTIDSLSNLASDGTAALRVRAFNPGKAEAKVAVQVDVAGKIAKSQELAVPADGEKAFELSEKLPAGVKEGQVVVRATHGGKTLLSYTAHFSVGGYNWMMAPVKARDPNKFAFSARFNPVRDQLLVKADTYYLPEPDAAKALRYTLKREGSEKVVAEGEVTRVAEWYFQEIVPLPHLEAGAYTVSAQLVLADGKALGPMEGAIEKKDAARAFPEWWGKKFGDIERVVPPFEPLRRAGGRRLWGAPAAWTCWGRRYELNALGLPNAVASQGSAVLAAPARLVVARNGKEETLRLGKPRITEAKDWRVRFEGEAAGAGLHFRAEGWLEQDGLVYVELTYRPRGGEPMQVDALRLEFPLSDADADCLVCVGPGANFASKSTILLPREKAGRLWSTLDTGRTGSNMKVGSFYPSVWIGSERRGLLWWADSDRGWFPHNDVPAHEAVRTGGAVVLRNNLIGKPVELRAERTVAFSYIASPFKPFPKGWRMIAATDDGTFFQPFRGVRKDSKTGEKLCNPGRGNVNWIHPESRYPEEWSALWAEQKQQADKLVHDRRPFNLYAARTGVSFQHMSFQLIGYGAKSLQKELYDYFGDEWFPSGRDTWNETYTDYAMYLFDRAFREGGVVSTYWDLTFPILYDSLLSGLCYRLPDGRVQPGYNGWNVRRFFMRLWALQHDHGLNPGSVGSHSTNAYVFVALPWLDAVLDGERDWHLDTSDMDWIDYYPVERMRSMSSPHTWGVGLCWMSNFTSADRAKIAAAKTRQAEYLWMHDSWLNPYVAPGPTVMPQSILDWGLNGEGVAYHPYWRNPHVECADQDILVSLWRLPDRVVVGVFNYHRKQAKDVSLKIDLDALGLVPQLPWQEFIGVRDLYTQEGAPACALDFYGRTLTLKALEPHSGRFIGIRKY